MSHRPEILAKLVGRGASSKPRPSRPRPASYGMENRINDIGSPVESDRIRSFPPPASDEEIAATRSAILAKLTLAVGKNPENASERDWFVAAALTARDRMAYRWIESNRRI